jgi:hypothetical protein
VTQMRNPLSDWFNYVFTYFPTTNWQHAFSPTINFGSNIQDAPVEQHVLDNVGSYGFQLNRVLDALSVIVEDPELKKRLNGNEKIKKFKELAKKANDAAKGFEDDVPTETSVDALIKGMHTLKHSDHELYQQLKDKLVAKI